MKHLLKLMWRIHRWSSDPSLGSGKHLKSDRNWLQECVLIDLMVIQRWSRQSISTYHPWMFEPTKIFQDDHHPASSYIGCGLDDNLRRKHGPIWVFQDDVFLFLKWVSCILSFFVDEFVFKIPSPIFKSEAKQIYTCIHACNKTTAGFFYMYSSRGKWGNLILGRHNTHVSFAHGYIHGRRRTQWPTSCSSLWSQISGLQRLQRDEKDDLCLCQILFINHIIYSTSVL